MRANADDIDQPADTGEPSGSGISSTAGLIPDLQVRSHLSAEGKLTLEVEVFYLPSSGSSSGTDRFPDRYTD